MRKFFEVIMWQLGLRKDTGRPHFDVPPYVPQYAKPDFARIKDPDPNTIQLTWVGQATFLIQVAGMNILTDPVWGMRASPFSWVGPRRTARPGIAFADLPKIDIALISHTHYDHLDRPTILKLGNTPHYIVPERLRWWFENEGITNVTELSWWQHETFGALTIHCVPAKHWSKRGLFRTNEAGWGGYVIESPAGVIYFAGDTGYHPDYFKEIGARFPNIELALIPIGAYAPRWFMQRFHVDPPEAVMIHQEVGAKKSIGMHWGTFKLTDEPMSEPPLYLAREAAAAKLSPQTFSTMKIGETRIL
jgi:L-ascorbate metabolism protein UlaG (beta-lactamase superfamily)